MSKMLNDPHITPIQTKILIALVKSKDGSLYTDEILRKTGIATSTWSAEQGKLVGLGLVNKHLVRIIEQDHVSKRMSYWLTDKGRMVGLNLLNISRILTVENENSRETKESFFIPENKDRTELAVRSAKTEGFDAKIRECVEIALDSFGSNLMNLVKNSLELEHHISWVDLSEKTEVFESILRDYFGLEASKRLRKLIAANVRTRFALENSETEDLSQLISEARKSNNLGTKKNEAPPEEFGAEV